MIVKICTAFSHCTPNVCLQQTSEIIIEIFDDDVSKKSMISAVPGTLSYPYFTIDNPNKKNVNFLSIDNCLLFDLDGDKCDFAVFYDSNFYFVEIKKGLGSTFNRSKKKEKALKQLKATLKLFLSKIDFKGFRIFACICVGYTKQSPAAPASDLNNLVEFINDYNAELLEGNTLSVT